MVIILTTSFDIKQYNTIDSIYISRPKASMTDWSAEAGGTPAARVRVLGDANFRCRGEKIPLAGSARVRGVSRLGLRAEAVTSS